KGNAVGQQEIAYQERHGTEIGAHPIDAHEGHIPLLPDIGSRPRVGEVDAAIGLDYHVVGPIEPLPLEAVGDHRDAAVRFLPRHAPALSLAGNDPALEIAGEAVGLVGVLLEHADALPRRVFHPLAGVDVAEQQIAAFLPPHRAFRAWTLTRD